MIFIIIILFVFLLLLSKHKEHFAVHPKIVYKCFSKKEIDSFGNFYKHSRIIYGKEKKSLCYITPTKYIDKIPSISWNGYYINNFCVEPHSRRKGYGKNLLDKIKKISYKEGKDHLILQVDGENIKAINFYKKNNFFNYFRGMDKFGKLKIFMVKYL